MNRQNFNTSSAESSDDTLIESIIADVDEKPSKTVATVHAISQERFWSRGPPGVEARIKSLNGGTGPDYLDLDVVIVVTGPGHMSLPEIGSEIKWTDNITDSQVDAVGGTAQRNNFSHPILVGKSFNESQCKVADYWNMELIDAAKLSEQIEQTFTRTERKSSISQIVEQYNQPMAAPSKLSTVWEQLPEDLFPGVQTACIRKSPYVSIDDEVLQRNNIKIGKGENEVVLQDVTLLIATGKTFCHGSPIAGHEAVALENSFRMVDSGVAVREHIDRAKTAIAKKYGYDSVDDVDAEYATVIFY